MKIDIRFQGDKLQWWDQIKDNVVSFKLPDIVPGPKNSNVFEGNLEVKFRETEDNKIESYFSTWMKSVFPIVNPTSVKSHFTIIEDEITEGTIQLLTDQDTVISSYAFKGIYPTRIVFGTVPDEFTKTIVLHID